MTVPQGCCGCGSTPNGPPTCRSFPWPSSDRSRGSGSATRPCAVCSTAWIGCPKHIAVCFENDIAAVWPKLRVRTGFDYVDPDPQLAYIGQNDGFFMDQARIGAEGTVRGIAFFKLTLDGASVLDGDPNQPVNPLLAAMRDAWVGFRPSPWLDVTVGQQNMPADYEGTDDIHTLILGQEITGLSAFN